MEELFETFGIDVRLLVIQAVNFGVVLVALWWFLYRPVIKVLEERRKKIAEGVRAAEEAQRAVLRNEAERETIVAEARHRAEMIIAQAEEEGKREREEIVKAAQSRADSIMADAHAQAEELKREILAVSEKEIARVAILAAEKILQKS